MAKHPKLYQIDGSKSWYFMYTDPKTEKRKMKSTGRAKKGEAHTAMEQFLEQLHAPEPTVPASTFREYAEPFFHWDRCPHVRRLRHEDKQIGETHVRKSRRWLDRALEDDEFSNLRITAIRRGDLLRLRDRLLEQIGPSNTLNKVIESVKTVLSEAYYLEDIDRNPGARVGKVNYEQDERDPLTAAELQALFAECPGVWRSRLEYQVFFVAAFTGMRSAEILKRPWRQYRDGVLEISPAKWRQDRTIPLAQCVRDVLEDRRDETVRVGADDLLFCYEDGRPLGVTWWLHAFNNALEGIGLARRLPREDRRAAPKWENPDGRNLVPHSLRHTLNTQLRLAGVSELLIDCYLWGHPHLKAVPAAYTSPAPEDLKPVAQAIDLVCTGTKVL